MSTVRILILEPRRLKNVVRSVVRMDCEEGVSARKAYFSLVAGEGLEPPTPGL